MKLPFARGTLSSRVWIALGSALLVAAGLLLIIAFLQQGPAAPEAQVATNTAPPTAVPASPTAEPTENLPAIVVSVNDYTITESYLEKATALNQVLSELARQRPLGETETLQRLIHQQLVLQGGTLESEPTDEDVQDYIGRMQEAWSLDEGELMGELEAAGVDRAFLEETIHRLLAVQATTEQLVEEGHDLGDWLGEQEQQAEIRILREMAERTEMETVAPEPTELLETEEPTEEPPTPTPRPTVAVPAAAEDFTLQQAGGGEFTLSQQLEEGPVVLVFFQRCG